MVTLRTPTDILVAGLIQMRYSCRHSASVSVSRAAANRPRRRFACGTHTYTRLFLLRQCLVLATTGNFEGARGGLTDVLGSRHQPERSRAEVEDPARPNTSESSVRSFRLVAKSWALSCFSKPFALRRKPAVRIPRSGACRGRAGDKTRASGNQRFIRPSKRRQSL
jgi:hypothetical protein